MEKPSDINSQPDKCKNTALFPQMNEADSVPSMADRAVYRADDESGIDAQIEIDERFLNFLPVPAVLMDESGFVTKMTSSAERLLGWTCEELSGKPVPFAPGNDLVRFLSDVRESLCNNRRFYAETETRGKDSRKLYLRLEACLDKTETKPVYPILIVLTDITKEKETICAMADKEAFLCDTSRLASVAGWELDPETGIITWTDDVCSLHAIDKNLTPTLANLISIFHAEDRPVIKTAFEQLISRGVAFDLELRTTINQHQVRHVHAMGKNEEIQGGKRKIYGVFQDITKRKQTEKALKESEERFRELNETIEDLFFSVSPDWSRVYYASPAFEKLFGLTTDLLYKKPRLWMDYIDPADFDNVKKALCADYDEHTRCIVFPEFRIKKTDDSIRWLSTKGFPIRDKSGNIVRIVGITRDITERKAFQEALVESESRFRIIIETAKDAIFMKDKNLKYTLVNRSCEKVFDKPVYEFIGKTAEDIFGKEASVRINDVDWRVLGGETIDIEDSLTINGVTRAFHVIKVPLLDNKGEIYGLCAFARDISEIKRMQASLIQNRKMEALDTLSGGIAHEFNNILGIILGNAEMAMEELQAEHPARASISEIMSAGLRARDIVRELLSFSRLSEGKLKPISISLITVQYIKAIKDSLPSSIEVQFENLHENQTIMANPKDIQTILFHLLTNAANAMKDLGGKICITIDTVYKEKNFEAGSGHFVRIAIKDTGKGIAPAIINRIFDPFFTTMDVGKGSGMGLSIVLGAVKRHKGYIDVESTPGIGSTFTVYIPKIPGVTEKAPEAPENMPIGNESILLLDDEPAITKLVSIMLNKLGYRVAPFTRPDHAIQEFKKNPSYYDLVITDLTMPDMSGLEFAVALLKTSPDIPIIIASGYGEKITEINAGKLGIRSIIIKPFSKKALAEKIREVLD